ncbi:MAG: chemotaxis protein CheB [Anaerolineae bacterium]
MAATESSSPVESEGASEPTATEVQETAKGSVVRFPVVGIGASAGGLAAFDAFFSGMPSGVDSGMAFVLVQHLSPDHQSLLPDLVRRYTRMPVSVAEDGMVVKPNSVYIIPPNHDLALADGALRLLQPTTPHGFRLPIDFFFRSLADDQQDRAICIVLSGTGSDGAQGVRAVKGAGGMAMAQEPESAEYDGMPRSAIATGLVDYVLPPAEMPAQLTAYVFHALGQAPRPAPPPPKAESSLKRIIAVLRTRTGHDFTQYKRNTITRRVERRMAVHQVERIEEYVRYLQQDPDEVEALLRDLLIGVTNFFRDPEAFAALEQRVIPRLFAGKPAGAPVRVWVPGCSTGEEAYSIAMLLQEHQEVLKQGMRLQVFATDIDRRAIELARTGTYPASIEADVSPERLERFFVREPDDSAYRIRKSVREMLVFSEHDVIRDPPFSRLDLISCRNLRIYRGAELQERLIRLFHYALNPAGFLFLGSAETVGDATDLMATLDRKWRLYQRRRDGRDARRPPLGSPPSPAAEEEAAAEPAEKVIGKGRSPLREMTEQALLQQSGLVAALVDERGEILYLHGRTGLYLEPAPGEAGAMHIMKMAREGLRRDLATALHRAVADGVPVLRPGLRVKTNGDFTTVNLTVRPVATGPDAATPTMAYLVVFEEAPAVAQGGPGGGGGEGEGAGESVEDADARLAALKQELRAKEEYLQTTVEELETANEELRSSNEESQSTNEELQSTNEELETSKEELQSVNEELATVNAELQQRVADLTQVSNDMNNLLSCTGIGTIFVDYQLRIRRFTPSVTQVINLIPSDVGRPVGHIVSNLKGYDRLVADVQSVLDTLEPREVEVQATAGSWFLLRIRPYRTADNVIEGAVITFFDISEMKRVRGALQEREAKWRLLFETMRQGVVFQDRDGRITDANPAAERLLTLAPGQVWGGESADLPWRAVREDGTGLPPEEYPTISAVLTGHEVRGAVMGIRAHGKDGLTWIRVDAIPQFRPGEDAPYQVYAIIDDLTDSVRPDPGGRGEGETPQASGRAP